MEEILSFIAGGGLVGIGNYFLNKYGSKYLPDKKDPKTDPEESIAIDPFEPELHTWQNLIQTLAEYDLGEVEGLRSVFLAMWRLESGMGSSKLAKNYLNFAGMKYRPEMAGYAFPVEYEAHDGKDTYCRFKGFIGEYGFIPGFIRFLDRSPYKGWREFADDPEGFINHIGKTWATDPNYVEKVLRNKIETDKMLGIPTATKPTDPKEKISVGKPRMLWWPSPNRSSRNGQRITGIVLHQTHGYNMSSAINWFRQSQSRVSAHYIVGRGPSDTFRGYSIVKMVNDNERAWHAGNRTNNTHIGIEIVARDGQQLDSEQEKNLIHLIKFLMQEYEIKKENITGHRFTGTATLCPGALFGARTEQALKDWVNRNIS